MDSAPQDGGLLQHTPGSAPVSQGDLLGRLAQTQQQQSEVLRAQGERLAGISKRLAASQSPDGLWHAKYENINMPFFAIMGFMFRMDIRVDPGHDPHADGRARRVAPDLGALWRSVACAAGLQQLNS